MEQKDFELKLAELKTALDAATDKKVKDSIEKEMKALEAKFPDLLKDVTLDLTEIKAWQVTKDEADKKNQEALNELIVSQQKRKTPETGTSFKDALGEAMEQKKADIQGYTKNRQQVSLELKAVGNMGSGNLTTSGTETFAGNTMIGGVGRKPYEISHIRNVVNVQPIATDSAYVIRDNAGEGGPTAVSMAAAKPQSDRDYVKLIVPVTKVAHYFKIPEEMLADNAWLQNEITAIGLEELLAKEDDLLLNQVAGAGLFGGLTTATNSTAFAAPASLALGVDLANNYDVLVAAWTQARNAKVSPNLVLCNPSDYAKMILTKESATSGAYVFGAPNIAIPNIFGIPLVPHTAMTSDKFLIGDFSKVTLGQRAGFSVRFYDQNEDDAIKNMVTVVIEERITIVAGRADYLYYGDFSDGRAALETA